MAREPFVPDADPKEGFKNRVKVGLGAGAATGGLAALLAAPTVGTGLAATALTAAAGGVAALAEQRRYAKRQQDYNQGQQDALARLNKNQFKSKK